MARAFSMSYNVEKNKKNLLIFYIKYVFFIEDRTNYITEVFIWTINFLKVQQIF